MGAHCCNHDHESPAQPNPNYRRILWIALIINAAMFIVELYYGFAAGSVSLLADSLDFFGDAANYGISLWVLAMSLQVRAKASLIKAASMVVFGIWVIGHALWNLMSSVIPDPQVMSVIGALALVANLIVAFLLYAYRDGDSNMRSVWLCTRNDALGNIAVMLAALGVFGTGSNWPDLIVAIIMAMLALTAAWQVMRQAQKELKHS